MIALLQEHGGRPIRNAVAAHALGTPPKNMRPCLDAAVQHGLIVKVRGGYGLPGLDLDGAEWATPEPARKMRTLKQVAADSHAERAEQAANAELGAVDATDAPPLNVVMYNDGDVAVKGHMVSDDGATAVYSRAQLTYLVQQVTRPFVEISP